MTLNKQNNNQITGLEKGDLIDLIKVLSKVSGKTGQIPVNSFDPQRYIPLQDISMYSDITQQIEDFKKRLTAPRERKPTPDLLETLSGPTPQIVGTVIGGAAFGIPGAATGGVIGKAISEATKEITGKQEEKNFIESTLTLAGAGIESAAAELGGRVVVGVLGKTIQLTSRGLRWGVEFIEGLPKQQLKTLFESPKKTWGYAMNKIGFQNIIDQTKLSVLEYGKRISNVYGKGIVEIKNLYPTLQIAKNELQTSTKTFLANNNFLTNKGTIDFTTKALDNTEVRALNNVWNEIKTTTINTVDDLVVLKQKLNQYFRSGDEAANYNRILRGMIKSIDNLPSFPSELKELNNFYSDKIWNFQRLSKAFDPKSVSYFIDKAESTLRGLLQKELAEKTVGKTISVPYERIATRQLFEEMERATGIKILDELKLFSTGKFYGERPVGLVESPFRAAQQYLQKITQSVALGAGGVKEITPNIVGNIFRTAIRELGTAGFLSFIKSLEGEPESKWEKIETIDIGTKNK